MATERKQRVEEHQISGEALVDWVKDLIHEGNVRHLILKNEEGHTLIEIPLTLGVVGAVLLPVWAAIGAIAAMAAHITIVVVRDEEEPDAEKPDAEHPADRTPE